MKVKYKDQVIEVCDGAIFEVVGGNLVITPKKQEFKDGDIVRTTHFIAIYKEATGIKLDFFNYVELEDDFDNDNVNELHYNSSLMPKELRFATKEEKQKLFDALKSKGKKWNPGTKQIEDILKVGDLAIFWDKYKDGARIGDLREIDESDAPYMDSNGWRYENAIKCTSLEQYINFKK
mgnify:CR=1 FL=1